MLSNLQQRKAAVLFNYYDANEDGFLEQADFERVANATAKAANIPPDAAKYLKLRDLFLGFWNTTQHTSASDTDQRVSLAEFIENLGYRNQDLDPKQATERVLQLFDVFDTDGDGRISRDEYRKTLSGSARFHVKVEEFFPRLDLDGDGYISREEYAQLHREFFGNDPNAAGNWIFGPY